MRYSCRATLSSFDLFSLESVPFQIWNVFVVVLRTEVSSSFIKRNASSSCSFFFFFFFSVFFLVSLPFSRWIFRCDGSFGSGLKVSRVHRSASRSWNGTFAFSSRFRGQRRCFKMEHETRWCATSMVVDNSRLLVDSWLTMRWIVGGVKGRGC